MSRLSNLNDVPELWMLLAMCAAAGVFLIGVARKRSRVPRLDLGISTRTYVICLIIAGAWSILQFIFLRPDMLPWGGSDRYFPRALNMLQAGVFGTGSNPSALFPPGYSFLLMPAILALGESPWTFFLTNLVLLFAHSVILRLILTRLGAALGTANLLATILVLYPNRLFGTLLPFSDIPFSLFWMTAFGLVLLSNRSPRSPALAAGAGISAGIAALIRSVGLVYLVPLLVALLAPPAERRGPRLLLFVCCFTAVLTPWAFRNYLLFGAVVPVSTNAGYNILVGNNPVSGAGWNRYVDTSSAVAADLRDAGGSRWSEAQRDSFYAHRGIANILSSPGTAVARACLKVAKTFGTDGYSFGLLETYTNAREITIDMVKDSPRPRGVRRFIWALYSVYYTIIGVLNGGIYYVLAGLTLHGLWDERRRRSDAWWVVILLILSVAIVVSLTFGLSRFKEPVGTAILIYLGMRSSRRDRLPTSPVQTIHSP